MKVFESFPKSEDTNNPYLAQLTRGLENSGAQVTAFSWTEALRGRYDVVHLHWPEALFAASTAPRRARRDLLFALWLLRLAVTRTPIVRTVHNIELPEGLPRHRLLLLRTLDRLTTARIRLNETTPVPPGSIVTTIPHGDYRRWLADMPTAETVPGRVAYVGQVRRYKNVGTLVAAYRDASNLTNGLSLHIGGRPTSLDSENEVREAAHGLTNVHLDLRHLEDPEMVGIVTEAEVVVLPYRLMHNSGSVFYALSLGRPVLVPDNEVNRALSGEVGHGWVHTFAGQLSGRHIVDTIAALRSAPPKAPPDLTRRDWDAAAAAHLQTFRDAIGRRT